MTNGSFSKIDSTIYVEDTSFDSFNDVYWNDVKCINGKLPEGTLLLQATMRGKDTKVQAQKKVKILTVNNMSLGVLKANKPVIDMGKEPVKVSLPSERINYYGTTTKIEKFEWNLPSGWKTASGNTGTFISESTSLDIITDESSEGEIKVRALNNYNGDLLAKSLFSSTKITRKGLGLNEYPNTIPFGEIKTYTFSVIGTGNSYEWQAPNGWSINGGGNTYTGTNSVQITTSKCPTNEKIMVKMAGASSAWTEFPTTVELPTIKVPTGQITQYKSSTFSLNMPNTDITSVEWLVDGKSVGVVNNTSYLSFSFNKIGNAKVSANLTMKECQSISIPAVDVNVIKAPNPSISGSKDLCEQATYSINNLPDRATVKWNILSSEWGVTDTDIVDKSVNGSKITLTAKNSGRINLEAVITLDGVLISTVRLDIRVAMPRRLFVTHKQGVEVVMENHTRLEYEYKITSNTNRLQLRDDINFNTFYNWKLIDGDVKEPYMRGGTIEFRHPPKYAKFLCTLSNSCGSSSLYVTFRSSIPSYPYSISVYPNPATSDVTIKLREEHEDTENISIQRINETTTTNNVEIQLWSATSLLRTYKTDQDTYQLSVSDLPKGIYFVHVIIDGKTYREKLIKN